MAYIENVNTKRQDTGENDAFGRLRVSQVNSQLDLKQLHDSLPLFYDIELIGTANDTYLEPEAHTSLTTAANLDAAIMQSHIRRGRRCFLKLAYEFPS